MATEPFGPNRPLGHAVAPMPHHMCVCAGSVALHVLGCLADADGCQQPTCSCRTLAHGSRWQGP